MPEIWDIYDRNRNKTGRFHERGMPMQKGEYHFAVHIWIMNNNRDFLISKRSPNIELGGMWHTTSGCVVAGEDSLTALLLVAEKQKR